MKRLYWPLKTQGCGSMGGFFGCHGGIFRVPWWHFSASLGAFFGFPGGIFRVPWFLFFNTFWPIRTTPKCLSKIRQSVTIIIPCPWCNGAIKNHHARATLNKKSLTFKFHKGGDCAYLLCWLLSPQPSPIFPNSIFLLKKFAVNFIKFYWTYNNWFKAKLWNLL